MLFNSIDFLLFFPIVVLLYYIIPNKGKYLWLLIASYYFYAGLDLRCAVWIFITTLITWLAGLFLQKFICCRKAIVFLSFFSNLMILAVFKYSNFLIENIDILLGRFGVPYSINKVNVLLPLGISFYTFKALGYVVDVYRGKITAESNFLKYALFVSFFPQLIAGPIERADKFLMQVNDTKTAKFNLNKVYSGLVWILWGLFQKMVIADRVAILVDTVFGSYYLYYSFELLIAAIGYGIQIYCDFASYSIMAYGAAQILGFEIAINFDTPYFSKTIKEFWGRWHISLSSWFRDYLYIPLGGNRRGKLKKYRNIFVTFLVSGIWHGANWTYIFWGGGTRNIPNHWCRVRTN